MSLCVFDNNMKSLTVPTTLVLLSDTADYLRLPYKSAYRRVDDLSHLQADCLYTGISSGTNAR